MELMNIANDSVDILRKNSPKILLGTGITLGAGAIVASSIASFKASDIIKDIQCDVRFDDKKLARKEYIKRIVPLYIPVAVLEAGSVVCLVKSYNINAKRLAAATALAEMSIETFKLYKEQTKKMLGEEKVKELEQEVRKEKEDIREKKAASGDPECRVQWFKDELTGQEFLSTKEHIKDAALELNLKLHSEMYVSVNEWIDILNDEALKCNDEYPLTHVLNGDDTGWEEGYPIRVSYVQKNGVETKDGLSCFVLEYSLPPRPGFRHRYY